MEQDGKEKYNVSEEFHSSTVLFSVEANIYIIFYTLSLLLYINPSSLSENVLLCLEDSHGIRVVKVTLLGGRVTIPIPFLKVNQPYSFHISSQPRLRSHPVEFVFPFSKFTYIMYNIHFTTRKEIV